MLKTVQLYKVKKTFGPVKALDSLCIEVDAGTILGIVGPNGAGKTTTIRLMLGLIKPDSGRVFLFGIDPYLDTRDSVSAKAMVGAMLENPGHISSMTVSQNLFYHLRVRNYPKTDISSCIDNALELVGLLDKKNAAVTTLSHGMMQRLALARALLGKPRLLVLDEPTSGLDPDAQVKFKKLIVKFKEDGGSVILSSHNLAEIEETCTHVLFLKHGRTVAMGKKEELRRKFGCYVLRVEIGNERESTAWRLKALEAVSAWHVLEVVEEGGSLVMKLATDNDVSCLQRRLNEAGIPFSRMFLSRSSLGDIYERLVKGEG